jgi:hypothetical protein
MIWRNLIFMNKCEMLRKDDYSGTIDRQILTRIIIHPGKTIDISDNISE